MPPQAEKRGREGKQAARRQNVPRAPPPERGKVGATVLKPPTTARRVQRVSSLVGVACVKAAPARRRPENDVARSCGLDALAAPPSFTRASGGGRAAVASSPAFCAGGRGYGLLRGGFVVCAAGGICARSRPVRPALRAGGWRAPPGVPQPRAPQTPASGQLRPPSGCCALPMGFFCAGGRGYGALPLLPAPQTGFPFGRSSFSGLPRFNRRFKAVLVPGGACPP